MKDGAEIPKAGRSSCSFMGKMTNFSRFSISPALISSGTTLSEKIFPYLAFSYLLYLSAFPAYGQRSYIALVQEISEIS
jgi:hypothetical protein